MQRAKRVKVVGRVRDPAREGGKMSSWRCRLPAEVGVLEEAQFVLSHNEWDGCTLERLL